VGDWRARFATALGDVQTSPLDSYSETIRHVVSRCRMTRLKGNRVFFIGNGGSAGIASHMAADWLKNGHFKAMCFNDGALMSCIENDMGHADVFAEPLDRFAQDHDILFAVSSSGQSENILTACDMARTRGALVFSLSGFDSDNKLREMAKADDHAVHFYVPSNEYGFVECAHQCILHEILDTVMERDAR